MTLSVAAVAFVLGMCLAARSTGASMFRIAAVGAVGRKDGRRRVSVLCCYDRAFLRIEATPDPPSLARDERGPLASCLDGACRAHRTTPFLVPRTRLDPVKVEALSACRIMPPRNVDRDRLARTHRLHTHRSPEVPTAVMELAARERHFRSLPCRDGQQPLPSYAAPMIRH